jgi:hypothetical protein
MMDERQMDIDVRAGAWEWLTKGLIKTKRLGYEGTPSQKREKGKNHFFLHKVSYLIYKTFL